MKSLLLFFSVVLFNTQSGWLTDFEQAKKIAVEKKQYILLNFSGSDWCGPCMRMKKEIFDAEDFTKYAGENLVLVNADFPRDKKNRLSKQLEKQNDRLAEKYNPTGKFPYTILFTSDGKLVKDWDGLPNISPKEFVQQIMDVSAKSK